MENFNNGDRVVLTSLSHPHHNLHLYTNHAIGREYTIEYPGTYNWGKGVENVVSVKEIYGGWIPSSLFTLARDIKKEEPKMKHTEFWKLTTDRNLSISGLKKGDVVEIEPPSRIVSVNNSTTHTNIGGGWSLSGKESAGWEKISNPYETKKQEPKEVFPAGTRVKSPRGMGTVVAKYKTGNAYYLIEHDDWRGGHDGNGSSMHLWQSKGAIIKSSGYYYGPQELAVIVEDIKSPVSDVPTFSPTQLDGFHVGETMRIHNNGSGIGTEHIGRTATIKELGVGKYGGSNGAIIAEAYGNNVTGSFNRWIGLSSFEKYTPTKEVASPPGCIGVQAKYNIGDEIEVCAAKMDRGWGWQGDSYRCEDYIQGVAGNKGKIQSIQWNTKRTEWSYKVIWTKPNNNSGGWLAEHAISLTGIKSLKGETPTPTPMDLSNTKIWIGNNPELSRRAQEAAHKLGWKSYRVYLPTCYSKDSAGEEIHFWNDKRITHTAGKWEGAGAFREIFPSDLGIIMTGIYEEKDKDVIKKFQEHYRQEFLISQWNSEPKESECILIKDVEEKRGMETDVKLQGVILMKDPPKPKLIIA